MAPVAIGVATASLLALSWSSALAGGGERYVVGLSHDVAKFGKFRSPVDRPGNASKKLRRAFGAPDRVVRRDETLCKMKWKKLGIAATLVNFGADGGACRKGTFIEAKLTDRRWHTPSGIRPGSPERAAREASLRRCRKSSCGAWGYALELHPSACADATVPGVIAQVPRGKNRVSALITRWRGCE